MRDDQLPDGFRAHRDDATLWIGLPEAVVTAAHVLEPVLTRADAESVAEAICAADIDARIERVVLLRDPKSSEESAASFRERLVGLFLEAGLDVRLDVEVAPSLTAPVPPQGRIPPVVGRA